MAVERGADSPTTADGGGLPLRRDLFVPSQRAPWLPGLVGGSVQPPRSVPQPPQQGQPLLARKPVASRGLVQGD